MKSNKKQRISDSTLREIEAKITEILKDIGTDTKASQKIRFDDTYFELDQTRIALCYMYKIGNKSKKIKCLDLINSKEIDITKENKKIRDEVDQWRELEGFCGPVPGDSESASEKYAVFINGDRNTPEQTCHVLIHETIHLKSYDSQGFQQLPISKQEKIPGMNEQTLTRFDEGMCELFARKVTDRLRTESADPIVRPEVPTFDGIPVYEYPMRIICSIAEDVGLRALGEAYFGGKWNAFIGALVGEGKRHKALKKGSKFPFRYKYGPDYFRKIKNLSIESSLYVGDKGKQNIGYILELRNYYGTDLPLPDEIRAAVREGSYNDPAIAVMEAQTTGNALYPWLALGAVAAAYAAYTVLADDE